MDQWTFPMPIAYIDGSQIILSKTNAVFFTQKIGFKPHPVSVDYVAGGSVVVVSLFNAHPLFVRFLYLVLVLIFIISILSSFAIILSRKRDVGA